MNAVTELQCKSCFAPLNTKKQHSNIITCEYCQTENVLSQEVRQVRAEYSHRFRVRLYEAISFSFGTMDDLRDLIIRLDGQIEHHRVDFESLSGSNTKMKSLELVGWCYRRTLLQELIDVALSLRPGMDL
jgi:hypothetical protein